MCNSLAEFRMSKKMTMKEFAIRIGVSKSYYEKIEYGIRQPSYSFMIKFVNSFPEANADKIFFESKSHETCEN